MVRARFDRQLPTQRAGMLTDRRVVPLPQRPRTGRPAASGALAPVFQLRAMPVARVPFGPDTAA